MKTCLQFEMTGRCKQGAACKFSHDATTTGDDNSSAPAYFYGQQQASSQVNITKTNKPAVPAPASSWANVAKLPQDFLPNRPQPAPITAPAAAVADLTSPSLPSTTTVAAACKFFSSGSGCKFGKSCRFSHDSPPAATTTTTLPSQSHQCGICLDELVPPKRIGLLTNCDHTFCFDCIRNWRASDMSEFERTKANVQLCPLCRTRSYFILPATQIPRNALEKQECLDQYRARCKSTPCRYNRDCPFGQSCLFYHDYAELDPARLGLEFVKTADGVDKAIVSRSAATLGDYLLK